MDPTVSDIIKVMESLAPKALAEDWDNVGLQVGDAGRPVKSIWIALDPTVQVVKAACQQKIDLLITHHPLIFKPLKSLNFSTPIGSVIELAGRHHLAIFAAHTNLDSVLGGINDILAERIGLNDLKPLVSATDSQRFKIVIHTPRQNEQQIVRMLLDSQTRPGWGTTRHTSAMPISNIHVNRGTDEILYEDQTRIEINVCSDELAPLMKILSEYHASDPIRYDVLQLIQPEPGNGIGRVGFLKSELELKSLAQMIKKKLKLRHLKFVGNPALPVKKAAVCSGSGASLLGHFFASGAEVFISGDMRYHDARDVESCDLGLIDIGHFSSEHLIVEELTRRLSEIFTELKMNITVNACDLEEDPFTVL